MNPTRLGKISRLSRPIREQLNDRFDQSEPGQSIVEWLNAQPEVQRPLQAQLDRRPITGQNLSVWKQGGFQDWLRRQESGHLVQRLPSASSRSGWKPALLKKCRPLVTFGASGASLAVK